MNEHMRLLGHRVEDVVTGLKGVVTSITFDLYGCVQALVQPPLDAKGLPPERHWFDVKRLMVKSDAPVMEVPPFAQTAPAQVAGGEAHGAPAEAPLP